MEKGGKAAWTWEPEGKGKGEGSWTCQPRSPSLSWLNSEPWQPLTDSYKGTTKGEIPAFKGSHAGSDENGVMQLIRD